MGSMCWAKRRESGPSTSSWNPFPRSSPFLCPVRVLLDLALVMHLVQAHSHSVRVLLSREQLMGFPESKLLP